MRWGVYSKLVRVPYAEAYAEGFEDLQWRVPRYTELERVTDLSVFDPTEGGLSLTWSLGENASIGRCRHTAGT